MLLGQLSISVTLNTLQSIYYAYFNYIIKYGIFLQVILPTVERFSLYKRKSSELRLVHNPEPHVKVYLNNYRLCLFHASLSSMNFIINNHEIFSDSSIHNINTRNKHHLHRPDANLCCYHKSTFYAGIKIFSSLPPSVTILKNDMAKFKAAFIKYLYTQPFYSVDEFCMCNDDL